MSREQQLPTENQLEVLRATITKTLPYYNGTLPLSSDNFILYYGHGDAARRIDLSKASDEELRHLAQSCEAATFGRGGEDVLDDSYRKAGKLDAANFVVRFDPEKARLIDAIRTELLPADGLPEQRNISAELYKLNVYGPGSFFKSHKDTPRAQNMFGSLVVVFPTTHNGGTLVLRFDDKVEEVDSAKLLREQQDARIAFIAFYSDVDHEVTLVESGYRVTLTYNLFFDPTPSLALPFIKHVEHHPAKENAFRAAFVGLLDDPTFYPDGGMLGFGLRHQYPLPAEVSKLSTMAYLKSCLKGSDAMLEDICHGLSLKADLKVIHELYDMDLKLCDDVCDLDGGAFNEQWPGDFVEGTFVRPHPDYYSDDLDSDTEKKYISIAWVTKMTKVDKLQSTFAVYGNDADIGYMYGYVGLLVEVGPYGHRETLT